MYFNFIIEIYIYIYNPFLHLMVFGKLFWIHNFGYKFIIHSLALFSFFFSFSFFSFFLLSYFFHLHTHINQVGPFAFSQNSRIATVFIFYENTLNLYFYSLYSNLTFRILKMKNEYKCLNQTSFFFFFFCVWPPLKTKNENKRHNFFQLTKHALSFFYKFFIKKKN